METFKAAHARLFSELQASGWKVTTFSYQTMKPLKVPYAEKWRAKIWFKPQALYAASGPGVTLNDARSIFEDVRGVTAVQVEARLEAHGHFR